MPLYHTRTSEDLIFQCVDAHHGAETFMETIQNYIDDFGDVDAEQPDALDVDDFIHVVTMLESVADLIKLKRNYRREAEAEAKAQFTLLMSE